jgi:hypothetical protein
MSDCSGGQVGRDVNHGYICVGNGYMLELSYCKIKEVFNQSLTRHESLALLNAVNLTQLTIWKLWLYVTLSWLYAKLSTMEMFHVRLFLVVLDHDTLHHPL